MDNKVDCSCTSNMHEERYGEAVAHILRNSPIGLMYAIHLEKRSQKYYVCNSIICRKVHKPQGGKMEKPRSFTDHEFFIEEKLEFEEDLPPGPVHSLWLLKVVLACALHDSNSLFAFPYAIFIPVSTNHLLLTFLFCIAGCTIMRILLYVGACTRVFMHKFTTSLTLLMMQMT